MDLILIDVNLMMIGDLAFLLFLYVVTLNDVRLNAPPISILSLEQQVSCNDDVF
jgi:hypothetical protein